MNDYDQHGALHSALYYAILLLRAPWTARRSNQSILKEISPEYSLEGLMLKLKFQYFGHLMQRTDSLKGPWCWKRVKAEGNDRGWDGRMASPTWWTWVWISSESWWWTGKPGSAAVHGVARSRTRLSDWTELKELLFLFPMSSPTTPPLLKSG